MKKYSFLLFFIISCFITPLKLSAQFGSDFHSERAENNADLRAEENSRNKKTKPKTKAKSKTKAKTSYKPIAFEYNVKRRNGNLVTVFNQPTKIRIYNTPIIYSVIVALKGQEYVTKRGQYMMYQRPRDGKWIFMSDTDNR